MVIFQILFCTSCLKTTDLPELCASLLNDILRLNKFGMYFLPISVSRVSHCDMLLNPTSYKGRYKSAVL